MRRRPGPTRRSSRFDAFSVNRGEILLIVSGSQEPPGKDIAGRVIASAADGSGSASGTRVVAHLEGGGWAQRVAVPTNRLAVLPDAVATDVAAALPLAGLTALRLLRAADGFAGRRVLLTGASGGVGHYLVELAANVGTQVTAVTSTPERGDRLLVLGAAREVGLGEPVTIGGFTATATQAADGNGDIQYSWLVEADGIKVLHCGDTLWHGGFWRLVIQHGTIDAVFLPINGPAIDFPHRQPPSRLPSVMTPVQAASAAAVIGARVTIPIHYGLFDRPGRYEPVPDCEAAFMQAAAERGVTPVLLAPGESVDLALTAVR